MSLRPWLVVLGVLAITAALAYVAVRASATRRVGPFLAGTGLVGGSASLLAGIWSPAVRAALATFVTSPGIGGLAAAAAAALALYGVLRQARALADQNIVQAEHNRAAEYATHYRWVAEQVLRTRDLDDADVIVSIIRSLFVRAVTEDEEQAALALLDRHEARINRSNSAPAPGDQKEEGLGT